MANQTAHRADIDALLHRHLPLVGHATTEMLAGLPGDVSREELVAAGLLGLREAAERFDLKGSTTFTEFANGFIRQALRERLACASGRDSSTIPKPAATGINAQVIRELCDDLDDAMPMSAAAIVLTASDVDSGRVAADLQTLPEDLRHVLVASFFQGRSLNDIAQELEVPEAAVVEQRSKALALLRDGGMSDDAALGSDARPLHGSVSTPGAAYYASVASASEYRSRLDSGIGAVSEYRGASG